MPDYVALTHLLLEPLLEEQSRLMVHCEITRGGKNVWLRVSFNQQDKGRVFGRGGRTISAVRQVLTAAAELAQQQLRFDVNDGSPPRSPRRR